MRYRDEELLDGIRAVADEVGRRPTLKEYRERGPHGVSTLFARFGSWRGAVAAAGFDPREPTNEVSVEELLAEIERLGETKGRRPTAVEMDREGAYAVATYRRRFGTWSNAVEAAGYEPIRLGRATDDQLLAELRRVNGVCADPPPSFTQMQRLGVYAPRTYVRRFGSWRAAVEAAGFEPRGVAGRIPRGELLADLHRVCERVGRRPTAADVREHGAYALATYQRRFGSWSAALEAAFGADGDTLAGDDDAIGPEDGRIDSEADPTDPEDDPTDADDEPAETAVEGRKRDGPAE
ncbi:homing endonuclease associated repeat-containing protein [Halorubrum vacuolatum]|uniref:Uncharacterized protein n=1 Tax=Halorubrum vacuolatum TaxID=63740 RepID=A0A238W4R2_HALVU|nr:hypothetical protein [Halorubrum vacuolatum]SNR41542.1 hypothetical protein SAMN06264855_105123 [Halorubrum vacuolatum]